MTVCVSGTSDGVPSGPLSVYGPDDTQGRGPETLTMTLTIADGYELDYIDATGTPSAGTAVTAVQGSNENEYTITMPAYWPLFRRGHGPSG